ncbi:DUF7285 family protein [Haloarcula nitratireducens]|uniref:Uncharacterized protein n=1 Tax=Haloarcula nitratireducens TaxID=2487749 RepID=A0AAW4P6V7_9EURY|nr:hypothetical protein [Halomicroarcula nitratireducens]MBX0293471.1 hypothetical protein [Halomicroarcula nitratireducens]
MSRSSARGATEPLAALVAVFAVSAGLALYAGVLDDALAATSGERNVAAPTADAVERHLTTAGVVDPERLDGALSAVPTGYEANVTLRAERRWSVGPTPQTDASRDHRTVSVALGPATVRRGTLRVCVWR